MHSPETTPPPACLTPSEAPTEDLADTEVRTTPLPTVEELLAAFKTPEDLRQFGEKMKVLIDKRREADRSDAKKSFSSDPDMSQEDYQDQISIIDKQYLYELSLVKGRVKEALNALGVADGDPASGGSVNKSAEDSNNESSADSDSEDSNNESSGGPVDSGLGGVANQLATQEFSSSSKKRRRESSEDGIEGEPAPKRFKQDSSDITGDGEPFDFGGGDD